MPDALLLDDGDTVLFSQAREEVLRAPELPAGTRYVDFVASGDTVMLVRDDGEALIVTDHASISTTAPPLLHPQRYVGVATTGASHYSFCKVFLLNTGGVAAIGMDALPGPPEGTHYTAAALGAGFALLLRDDGRACCFITPLPFGLWDPPADPRPRLPHEAGTRYVAVAAWGFSAVLLQDDGHAAYCTQDDPTFWAPPEGRRYVSVAMGHQRIALLRDDGRAVLKDAVHQAADDDGDDDDGVDAEPGRVPPLPPGMHYEEVITGENGDYFIFIRSDGQAIANNGRRVPPPPPGRRYQPRSAGPVSLVVEVQAESSQGARLLMCRQATTGEVLCTADEDATFGKLRAALAESLRARCGHLAVHFITPDGMPLEGSLTSQVFPKHQESLRRLRLDGSFLRQMPLRFRQDRELVFAAVQQNALAIQFADSDLRRDRDLVFAAVQQNALAIQFADSDLRRDRELVLAAVQQNGLAVEFADSDLLQDRDLALAAVRQNGLAIKHFPESDLRGELAVEAVRQNVRAVDVMPRDMHQDRSVMLEAFRRSPKVYSLLSQELLADPELAKVKQQWLVKNGWSFAIFAT